MPATLSKESSAKKHAGVRPRSFEISPKSRKIAFNIGGIVRKLGKQIEANLSQISESDGRQELHTTIFIDGNKVTHGQTVVKRPASSKAAPAKEDAPQSFDPFEAGRRAVVAMQQAAGGAWTGSELEKELKLTPATLHKRRSDRRIVFWKDAKNQFHYPKWQFNAAGAVLPGVKDVLKVLNSSDEWRVMRYFLAPRHQLDDQTPLDLLRAGDTDTVVAHAKAHGQENSW